MTISDPRSVNAPRFLQGAAQLLNDPRDVSVLWLMLQCGSMALCGSALFLVPEPWTFYLAPFYWVFGLGALLDRFTLMLHFTSHRPLFKKGHGLLNRVIPWLLAPFFGQTPNTYFAHHMGMHHREENLAADLSSTGRFQRDRLDHWLRYYLRFMLIGLPELCLYFARRQQWKLMWRVIAGEGVYWSLMALLLWQRPAATLIVLLLPLIVIRTLMMMGNWTQHSFVSAQHPEDPYQASITCLNTRYNRRCFNDGYHVLHHVQPRAHWTDHPQLFETTIAEYAEHDSIVFDGLDYFQIWLCLMFQRWGTLADRFVRLEGAPQRSRDEVIAFLKSRVRPLPGY
jgi:fatty acid desaturase